MPLVHTLEEFQNNHDFFVGLDSDGCVFDSMEIKHKECFTPVFIKHFKLQAASKYARRAWEFANLYSVARGMNRFPVLVRTLRLLQDWPDAMARGIRIPDLQPLDDFIGSGLPPSNAGLTDYMKPVSHPLLGQKALPGHFRAALRYRKTRIPSQLEPRPQIAASQKQL